MTTPRYITTEWAGIENFECLLCPFKTLNRGAMIRHVRAQHPTAAEGGEGGPLDGVPFASARAAELALESGLALEDFTSYTPTGEGGYTADDVRHLSRTTEED